MFNKKARLIITVALSAALLLSGCGNSTAELSDGTISESTALQTSAGTTTATEAVTETTTKITTAATTATTTETETETTTKATTATTAETTTETTTAATTETTAAPTTTVTTAPTTTETTTETTTITTTETTTEATTEDLTPEELEIYNSMPDIVFVCSVNFGPNTKCSNIRGFYITKDGEVKLYAFSNEEARKYMNVVELYDELESVTDPQLLFFSDRAYFSDEIPKISKSKLIKEYQKLLLVDNDAKIETKDFAGAVSTGAHYFYGVRQYEKNTIEFVYMKNYRSDQYCKSTDPYAVEIYQDMCDIFPNMFKSVYDNWEVYYLEEYVNIWGYDWL